VQLVLLLPPPTAVSSNGTRTVLLLPFRLVSSHSLLVFAGGFVATIVAVFAATLQVKALCLGKPPVTERRSGDESRPSSTQSNVERVRLHEAFAFGPSLSQHVPCKHLSSARWSNQLFYEVE
jgi:hypothetical protein